MSHSWNYSRDSVRFRNVSSFPFIIKSYSPATACFSQVFIKNKYWIFGFFPRDAWECFFVINTCLGVCLFWWDTSIHPVSAFLCVGTILQSMQALYPDCLTTHYYDNTFFLPPHFIMSSTGVLQTQHNSSLLAIYSLLLKLAILIHSLGFLKFVQVAKRLEKWCMLM